MCAASCVARLEPIILHNPLQLRLMSYSPRLSHISIRHHHGWLLLLPFIQFSNIICMFHYLIPAILKTIKGDVCFIIIKSNINFLANCAPYEPEYLIWMD